MSELRLIKKSNRETVETLEWMLQEAKGGRLNDFVATFRHRDDGETAAFTGLYKADSAKALMAIMRMSQMLTRAHDTVYGPP